MTDLHQFTTEYSELEDRIKLSGATTQGLLVIWLTQRMLQRLLPLLLQWLERQQAATPGIVSFSFMQQTVQPCQEQPVPDSVSWLATSIDILTTDKQVSLTFKSADGPSARIVFAAELLRQWLDILQDAYLLAQWPLDAWPAWLTEQALTFKGTSSAVWH